MKQLRINNWEIALLISCVSLSAIIHWIFVISGFAEPDMARLANLAVEWHQTGTFSTYSYVLRTSPLYLHAIKSLLALGVPLETIPAVMNYSNVIMGSLILIPLYYLWRYLANWRVGVLACILFSFSPSFWMANIYGMPHLPSFGLFLAALLLFALASARSDKNSVILIVLSTVFMLASVSLKADIILCCGAFFGVTFYLGASNQRNIIMSFMIPIVGLIGCLLYTKLITPPMQNLGDSAELWSSQYPFTITSLLSRENSLILANSAGKLLFSMAVLSTVYCVMWRVKLRAFMFSLVWALPPILFWGLKMGNSARHMMASYSVLMFLVAIVYVSLVKKTKSQWLLIILILAANYWVSPSEGGLGSPTARLHRLTASNQAFSDYRHRVSAAFADIDIDQKLYAGAGTAPYVVWESLLGVQSFEIVQTSPQVYRLKKDDDSISLLRIELVKSPSTVGPQGKWLVFSFEPGITVLNDPRFEIYYSNLVETARNIRRQIDSKY